MIKRWFLEWCLERRGYVLVEYHSPTYVQGIAISQGYQLWVHSVTGQEKRLYDWD